MPATDAAHLDWQLAVQEGSIGSFIDAAVSSTIMTAGKSRGVGCGISPHWFHPPVPLSGGCPAPAVPTITEWLPPCPAAALDAPVPDSIPPPTPQPAPATSAATTTTNRPHPPDDCMKR
jgi:hypothetical protein